jgi:hypothetical protein
MEPTRYLVKLTAEPQTRGSSMALLLTWRPYSRPTPITPRMLEHPCKTYPIVSNTMHLYHGAQISFLGMFNSRFAKLQGKLPEWTEPLSQQPHLQGEDGHVLLTSARPCPHRNISFKARVSRSGAQTNIHRSRAYSPEPVPFSTCILHDFIKTIFLTYFN